MNRNEAHAHLSRHEHHDDPIASRQVAYHLGLSGVFDTGEVKSMLGDRPGDHRCDVPICCQCDCFLNGARCRPSGCCGERAWPDSESSFSCRPEEWYGVLSMVNCRGKGIAIVAHRQTKRDVKTPAVPEEYLG